MVCGLPELSLKSERAELCLPLVGLKQAVSMYVYIYIHVHIYMYIHVQIRLFVCPPVCLYVWM